MKVLSNLFKTFRLSRSETACSRPHRRHRIRRQRSALSCETLEPKRLLAADVAVQFSDQILDTTDPVNVAIEGKFGDTAVSGTVVKFETNAPLADNDFYVELTDNTPLTNANFLSYVNSGAYNNSLIHRSVSNFVVQGGGYSAPTLDADQPGSDPFAIPTTGTIQNEPGNANTRGTIAMAKLGGQPDSASSQFFFNIDNNLFLDSDNGGYTVFGEVLGSGMTVVDTMASALTYDAVTYYSNTALSDLPLWNINQDNIVRPNDFVKIENVDVVTESDLFTYQVSSSDAAKLTASFDGNGNLVLTPNSSATGSVDVTVIATSTLDNSTATDTFSVQLNGGGGSVGPGLTAIEEIQDTTFNRDQDGNLYAGTTPIMVAGSPATLTRYPNLTYIGVETVNGQNTLLAIDSRINGPRRWFLDADWNYITASNSFPASGTAELYAIEEGFQYDIDGNSEIGGTLGTVYTAIEEVSSTTFNRDQDGNLYAGTTPIMVAGSPATLTRYPNLTYIGVETVNGQNTLLAIDSRINGPRRWFLDADWNYITASNSFPASGTAELYAIEEGFQYDIDGNSEIGGTLETVYTAIEEVSSTTFNRDQDGNLYAGTTPIMVAERPATLTRYPNLTYIGVETVNGQNTLLAIDSRINGPRRWILDADWNFVTATNSFPASGTAELYAIEEGFQYDIDGNSEIGGTLGTIFTAIEEVGSTTFNRDQDGNLYAGTTPIMVAGSPATLTRYPHLTYIGVENVGGVNRLLAIDARVDGLRRWTLDENWNYITASYNFPDADSAELYAYEEGFQYDIDVNSEIGEPLIMPIEQVGSVTLNRNTDTGQLFAGEEPILVAGSPLTLTRYPHLTYIGVENVDGVNRLLAIDARVDGLRRWTLDTNWNYVTASYNFPNADSAELYAYEEGFQYDIDGNSEIGGTLGLVFTAIEEVGSTTLNRDQDGNLYAGTTPIMVAGSPATLTRYPHLTYIGVENVGGVNRLLAIDARVDGLRRWTLDENWNYITASYNFPDADTNELYEYETAFEYDVDANTTIGGPSAVIAVEQVGSVTLNRNTASGQYFAGDVPIMVAGSIVTPTRYPHLTYIGVDTIDGVNILLATDSRVNGPRRWTLDADWNFVSATYNFPGSGTEELSSLEQAFQYDIDGDLQIGS